MASAGPRHRREAARWRSRGNHGGLDVACGDGDGPIGLEERATLEASLVPVTTPLRALHHPTSYEVVKRKSKAKWAPARGPQTRACTASALTSSVTARTLNRPPELPKKSQRGGVPECLGAGQGELSFACRPSENVDLPAHYLLRVPMGTLYHGRDLRLMH